MKNGGIVLVILALLVGERPSIGQIISREHRENVIERIATLSEGLGWHYEKDMSAWKITRHELDVTLRAGPTVVRASSEGATWEFLAQPLLTVVYCSRSRSRNWQEGAEEVKKWTEERVWSESEAAIKKLYGNDIMKSLVQRQINRPRNRDNRWTASWGRKDVDSGYLFQRDYLVVIVGVAGVDAVRWRLETDYDPPEDILEPQATLAAAKAAAKRLVAMKRHGFPKDQLTVDSDGEYNGVLRIVNPNDVFGPEDSIMSSRIGRLARVYVFQGERIRYVEIYIDCETGRPLGADWIR